MELGKTKRILFVSCLWLSSFFIALGQQSETSTELSGILKEVRSNSVLSYKEKSDLLERAFTILEETESKDYNDVSFAALRSGDSLLFRKYNNIVIQKAQKRNLKFAEGMAHWDRGDFFKTIKPDSAFYHYQKAYSIISSVQLDESNIHLPGSLLLNISDLKDNIKDYIGAEKDVIAAIEYLKEKERPDRLFSAYDRLGIIQNGLSKPEKALEYYQKAKTYIEDAPKNRRIGYLATNANNTAAVYLRQKDFKTAYSFYDDLLKRPQLRADYTRLFATVITSKAYSGYKSNYIDLQQFQIDFKKSNSILDSIGNNYKKARNYEFYARILVEEKDTTGAVKQALIAKNMAQESMNNDRLLSSLKLLVTIDKENSAQHAQRYFTLNEELQQQEREIQDKFARIRLETDEIIEENEDLIKDRKLLTGIAIGLLILGISVIVIISQKVSNQRLKFKQKQQESNQEIYNLMLSQQGKLEEGKKTEQKRISEELHDGVLGQLLGIRLFFGGLNERSDPDAVSQREELLEKMRDVEEEIRTISHELNEAAYQKVDNFMMSIQQLVLEVSDAANLPISFDFDGHYAWDSLDGDLKINIYRIVQECLQNCVKHAKCKNIEVNFASAKKILNLSVKDDGVGFDGTKGKKGIGLRNIISRAHKIAGKMDITSSPGKGTTIHIRIPLAQTTKEENIRRQSLARPQGTV